MQQIKVRDKQYIFKGLNMRTLNLQALFIKSKSHIVLVLLLKHSSKNYTILYILSRN